MIPLSFSKTNEIVTIIEIKGKPEVKRHLEDLGFVVGCPVKVISSISGNLIVSVKDSRVALDKILANKIMVN